jgi:hypothetical protein
MLFILYIRRINNIMFFIQLFYIILKKIALYIETIQIINSNNYVKFEPKRIKNE